MRGRVGTSRTSAFRYWAIQRLAGKRLVVLNADFRDGSLYVKPTFQGGLIANCVFEATQPPVFASGTYRDWQIGSMSPRVRHLSVTEFSNDAVCGAELRVGDEITFSVVDTTCPACLERLP